jgi:hypothetical protein
LIKLLKYSEWISENYGFSTPEWREGGIVLIKGNVLRDGYPRLYLARISNLWINSSGARMVKLQPEIHIVLREGMGFVAKKIMTTPEILKNALGLSSYSLALNSKTGKTPLWESSIKTLNIPGFLKDWERVLESYEEFKY